MRRRIVAGIGALLFLSGCSVPVSNGIDKGDGMSGSGSGETVVVGSGRLTLNPMNQMAGLGGRAPSGDEWPELGLDWAQNIPATNADKPAAFPWVDYQDVSFARFQDAELEKLEVALADVEQTTGIGPWVLEKKNGGSCGPADPRSSAGSSVGAYASFTFLAHVETTASQVEQVVAVLERHYPGLTQPGNIWRVDDEPDHQTWRLASSRDDALQVTYKENANDNFFVSIVTGCFITADHVNMPTD